MSQVTAYIGLGSNLSDPATQLTEAISAIEQLPHTQLIKCSSFYASTPLGPQDQPDFVNAVCAIRTQLNAHELLTALQSIEQSQGRIKKRHWGERLIDLDILLFGDEAFQTENLTIPHAQMHLRDFVLIPLQEIAPNIEIPNLACLSQLIAELEESFLVPIDN